MSTSLPELEKQTQEVLLRKTASIVNSMDRRRISSYLLVAFTQNAQLTAEVNRLRALAGEEPLQVYDPKAGNIGGKLPGA